MKEYKRITKHDDLGLEELFTVLFNLEFCVQVLDLIKEHKLSDEVSRISLISILEHIEDRLEQSSEVKQ